MWKKIALTIIALWLPVSGNADEPAGRPEKSVSEMSVSEMSVSEIAGWLDDEQRAWFVLSRGHDSNASFIEHGDNINVDITGFVDERSEERRVGKECRSTGFVDEASWESEEALLISLTIHEQALLSAVVIHPLGESLSPPLYTSEGGQVTVTLEHFERTSQWVRVAGSIKGMLALQAQLGEPPAKEEGIEINVAFDVKAQKIEF